MSFLISFIFLIFTFASRNPSSSRRVISFSSQSYRRDSRFSDLIEISFVIFGSIVSVSVIMFAIANVVFS